MKREALIKKTLAKFQIHIHPDEKEPDNYYDFNDSEVHEGEIQPSQMAILIKTLKSSTDPEFIYNYLFKSLKGSKSNEEEIRVTLERLMNKEKLQNISKAHKDAFKRLLEVYPFVNIKL